MYIFNYLFFPYLSTIEYLGFVGIYVFIQIVLLCLFSNPKIISNEEDGETLGMMIVTTLLCLFIPVFNFFVALFLLMLTLDFILMFTPLNNFYYKLSNFIFYKFYLCFSKGDKDFKNQEKINKLKKLKEYNLLSEREKNKLNKKATTNSGNNKKLIEIIPLEVLFDNANRRKILGFLSENRNKISRYNHVSSLVYSLLVQILLELKNKLNLNYSFINNMNLSKENFEDIKKHLPEKTLKLNDFQMDILRKIENKIAEFETRQSLYIDVIFYQLHRFVEGGRRENYLSEEEKICLYYLIQKLLFNLEKNHF